MSATCPNGHASATDDYCDTCGATIDATASPGPASASPSLECANCGRAHEADELFCEVCGLDFTTGKLPEAPAAAKPAAAPPTTTTAKPAPSAGVDTGWVLAVATDRAFFDNNQAESPTAELTFPDGRHATDVPLRADEVLVGRRSEGAGIYPEVDLTGPLDDPGVSRRHALLRRTADGWELVDQDSTNGTRVNGAPPVTAGQAVALADGDRIHVGAWTCLTLRRATP